MTGDAPRDPDERNEIAAGAAQISSFRIGTRRFRFPNAPEEEMFLSLHARR